MGNSASVQSRRKLQDDDVYFTAREIVPNRSAARAYMMDLVTEMEGDAAKAPQPWADKNEYYKGQVLETNESYDKLEHAYDSLNECYLEALTIHGQKDDRIDELNAELPRLRAAEYSLSTNLAREVEKNDRLYKRNAADLAKADADASRLVQVYNAKTQECDQLRQELLESGSKQRELHREIETLRIIASDTSSTSPCTIGREMAASGHNINSESSSSGSAPSEATKHHSDRQWTGSKKAEQTLIPVPGALCQQAMMPWSKDPSAVTGTVRITVRNHPGTSVDFSEYKIPEEAHDVVRRDPLSLVSIQLPEDLRDAFPVGTHIRFDADMIQKLKDQLHTALNSLPKERHWYKGTTGDQPIGCTCRARGVSGAINRDHAGKACTTCIRYDWMCIQRVHKGKHALVGLPADERKGRHPGQLAFYVKSK